MIRGYALRTKKPGFLTDIEGSKQVFGLKNPVSEHPFVSPKYN